jgi:hypothetical protein
MKDVCWVQNKAKHFSLQHTLSNVSAKTHPLSCKVFLAFGDHSPLAYDTLLIGKLLLTFKRSLMPPPSGKLNKNNILEKLVSIHCTETVCEGDSCTQPMGGSVEAR